MASLRWHDFPLPAAALGDRRFRPCRKGGYRPQLWAPAR